MSKKFICSNCGYLGQPKIIKKGSDVDVPEKIYEWIVIIIVLVAVWVVIENGRMEDEPDMVLPAIEGRTSGEKYVFYGITRGKVMNMNGSDNVAIGETALKSLGSPERDACYSFLGKVLYGKEIVCPKCGKEGKRQTGFSELVTTQHGNTIEVAWWECSDGHRWLVGVPKNVLR